MERAAIKGRDVSIMQNDRLLLYILDLKGYANLLARKVRLHRYICLQGHLWKLEKSM